MNLLKKLKLVTGFKSEEEEIKNKNSQYEVLKTDSVDVIFAKTLIKNNGNFFYCQKNDDLIKTICALNEKLNIQSLYCIEPVLQELIDRANLKSNKKDYQDCDAVLSSCEYLIAHEAKIMLSSKQLGSNNIKNLPKEHIIIAYTSQIVKNLNEAMGGLNKRYITNLPSTITTIKSEKIVESENQDGHVKKLSVLLVEDYQ